MRLVLLGDGESPHLLKWARALAPQVELWAASSRGFLPDWDGLVPPERRLALATRPKLLLLDEPMAGMGFQSSGSNPCCT